MENITLTKGQEEAIKVAVQRYKDNEKYTVIAGAAGSGKTTTVRYIVDALNVDMSDVVFATFTGKASLVLRNKGCHNAMTLHRLLYIPKTLSNGDIEFEERATLEYDYKIVVVDEVSMVPQKMWELLLSHQIYVIALGDMFQLPPISGNATVLEHPHVVLTEIMRQALDNPIIRLSMDIREGKTLSYGGPKEARIIPKEKVSNKLLLGADIVLCGRNDTRMTLNSHIRKLKWGNNYQDAPIEGDRIIALKNDWWFSSDTGEALINGELGEIRNIRTQNTKLLKPKMTAQFWSDTSGVFRKVCIDYKLLRTGIPTVTKENYMDFYKVQKPKEFAYGYVVTVHKFQGSQANKVLVYAERLGDREYFAKWLYTACTRAVEQVVIVM
jgi:exodeoxyribonuclease-5